MSDSQGIDPPIVSTNRPRPGGLLSAISVSINPTASKAHGDIHSIPERPHTIDPVSATTPDPYDRLLPMVSQGLVSIVVSPRVVKDPECLYKIYL